MQYFEPSLSSNRALSTVDKLILCPEVTRPVDLSSNTCSASCFAVQSSGLVVRSVPEGGPTDTLTVKASIRLTNSHTILWRASAVSGAADEYFSGLRDTTIGSAAPEEDVTGYSNE
jgi:hypothetical protein